MPAILTILIGFFIYDASFLINVEATTPGLIVKTTQIDRESINDSTVRDVYVMDMVNNTQNVIWHNLQITWICPHIITIDRAIVKAIPPAAPLDTQPLLLEHRQHAVFTIKAMQPGNQYQLEIAVIAKVDDYGTPELYINHCDEAVKSINSKVGFWLYEHNSLLRICLLLISLCAIVIYFYWLWRTPDDKLPG